MFLPLHSFAWVSVLVQESLFLDKPYPLSSFIYKSGCLAFFFMVYSLFSVSLEAIFRSFSRTNAFQPWGPRVLPGIANPSFFLPTPPAKRNRGEVCNWVLTCRKTGPLRLFYLNRRTLHFMTWHLLILILVPSL